MGTVLKCPFGTFKNRPKMSQRDKKEPSQNVPNERKKKDMKNKVIIPLIIIIILILGIVTYFATRGMNQKNKDYQIEEISQYKYFVYQEDGKFGVLDTTGQAIISAKYTDVKIPNPSKAVFVCYVSCEIAESESETSCYAVGVLLVYIVCL